jgi:hypothetical protein
MKAGDLVCCNYGDDIGIVISAPFHPCGMALLVWVRWNVGRTRKNTMRNPQIVPLSQIEVVSESR